jgi:phosphoribosylformimino-5-aminoimidazole carboxamide ribonucleotide (ProFAR) isomerase
VKLNTEPTANVAIGLSSGDTTEGTVSPASLTFTTANWATPQTVTVTGVNDFVDDGDIAYTIITAAAAGGDYAGLNASDVSATNSDNDTRGITVNPTSGLTTTEAGGTATFTVVLASQPTADVSIGLSSSDTTEGTVSPASLTFTTVNWSTTQTVTVTGVDDFIDDGNIAYTIITAAATGGDYAGLNASDVSATNTDNDTVGITVNPTSGLTTTEAGGNATFIVKLNTLT